VVNLVAIPPAPRMPQRTGAPSGSRSSSIMKET
jgi:hypothetical protein